MDRPEPTPEHPQHLCLDKDYDNATSKAVVRVNLVSNARKFIVLRYLLRRAGAIGVKLTDTTNRIISLINSALRLVLASNVQRATSNVIHFFACIF